MEKWRIGVAGRPFDQEELRVYLEEAPRKLEILSGSFWFGTGEAKALLGLLLVHCGLGMALDLVSDTVLEEAVIARRAEREVGGVVPETPVK